MVGQLLTPLVPSITSSTPGPTPLDDDATPPSLPALRTLLAIDSDFAMSSTWVPAGMPGQYKFVRVLGESRLRVYSSPAPHDKHVAHVWLAGLPLAGVDQERHKRSEVDHPSTTSTARVRNGDAAVAGRLVAAGKLVIDSLGRLDSWSMSPEASPRNALDNATLGSGSTSNSGEGSERVASRYVARTWFRFTNTPLSPLLCSYSVRYYRGEAVAHLAGQAGLPLDKFWIWLSDQGLEDWVPDASQRARLASDFRLLTSSENGEVSYLVKAASISDDEFKAARCQVREAVRFKVKLRQIMNDERSSDQNGARLRAATMAYREVRGRVLKNGAMRAFKCGRQERRLSRKMLSFTARSARYDVVFCRLYPKVKTVLNTPHPPIDQ